ncbi:MAG: hypothetical protein WC460_05755 [Patescibacteria group bacterium]
MTEPDEKFTTKDIDCPNCHKTNRLVIIEKGHALSEKYQILLTNAGCTITNSESEFVCNHCDQKNEIK